MLGLMKLCPGCRLFSSICVASPLVTNTTDRAYQATITPDEQLRIVVEALVEFIERKVA